MMVSKAKWRSSRKWSIDYVSVLLLMMVVVMVMTFWNKNVSGFSVPPTTTTFKRYAQYRVQENYHCGKLYHHSARRKDDESFSSNTQSSPNKEEMQFLQQHPSSIIESSVNNNLFAQDTQSFVTAMTLALILLFSGPVVPAANAGFGPSSGATTSPPPNLIAPNIQDKDIASQKKLKQLIGSTLDEKRLQEFRVQLDDVTESLLKKIMAEEEEEEADVLEAVQQTEAELEKARLLQQQIADREKLLAKLEKQPYWFNYLAAFVGSVASTLMMHPLDTIKTRLQVKREDDYDEGGNYNILSLYEGLSGNILKEGPPSALYLGVYESVKYSLLPMFGLQYRLLIYLTAGAAGEMVGSIVRAPAEAIKSLVQSGIASSATDAAIQVFGTPESRTNVIRAWSSSVWRDVPFGAIQLAIFELTKAYILNNPNIDFDSSTLLSEAIIGAFAGGCGAFLTNPFDIITTRIITQPVGNEQEDAGRADGNVASAVVVTPKPLGVLGMGKKVYDEGGFPAFFVGWQARVGYWAPAISIFLTCYCSVRQAGIANNWF